MAFEKRDNSGALFRAKANENPNWPTHEGSAMVNGVEYWLSAWVKEGKNGKFFSLAFKPKDTAKKPAPKKIDPARGPQPENDDIDW
jgi:hypothetical protein